VKYLKSDAGEESRRSFGTIFWKMEKYYIKLGTKGATNMEIKLDVSHLS